MLYLFIGQDTPAKDLQLKKIKDEFLKKELEQFNLDLLYSRDLTLKNLQEKLYYLPFKNSKRLIVIREAQALKTEIKDFLLEFASKPVEETVLVLDFGAREKRDEFINRISRRAKVIRFKEEERPDTFTLSRSLEAGRPDLALKLLNQLLKEGEKPERILGGLRYAWEKGVGQPREMKRRLKLLITCDLDIKTGRLKAHLALEKLVIGLCFAVKPLH